MRNNVPMCILLFSRDLKYIYIYQYIAIQLIGTVCIGHTNSFSNILFLNHLSTLICFEKEKKKRDYEMTRVCLQNEAPWVEKIAEATFGFFTIPFRSHHQGCQKYARKIREES